MLGKKKKASQAQTEANRRNAQHSTGPKIEAGKPLQETTPSARASLPRSPS